VRKHRLVERKGMRALLRLLAVFVVLLSVRAASAAPVFSFEGERGTFRPETPVRISIQSYTALEVEVEAVPISLDELISVERNAADPKLTADITTDRRPIKTVRASLPYDPKHPLLSVEVGKLKSGFYALRVRANGEAHAVRLAAVTSLGVVSTDVGDAFTAYALDFRTLHARRDVTFERYRAGSTAVETIRPDATGLVSFRRTPETGVGDLLVVRGDDGAAVVARGVDRYRFGNENVQRGFVHTDRPIYRPGDRVQFRAILREGAPGAYTVPSAPQPVKLRDPNGKTIFTLDRKLDEFGTISGEIPLGDDPALGSYRLTAGTDEYPWVMGTFEVQAYKKPEFVLDVSRPAATPGGEVARFGVAARYFFGRPAAGMRLHYRAYLRDAYAWWRRGSPFRFAGFRGPSNDTEAPPVEGDLVADASGRATIAIKTDRVTSERQLTVEIDGRDSAGRTVTAEAISQVTPGSFFLTVQPKTYFNTLGDTVELTLRSLGYGPRTPPRPGTPISVTFTRFWWDRGSHQEQGGAAESVVTGDDGSATVRWKPSSSGYFSVQASARDERGRDISTTTGVWIASERYDRGYTFDEPQVVPQKAEYAPGEHATLLVTAPQGDVDALVHVVGGATDRVFLRRLTTTASTLDVEPPPGVATYRVTVSVPMPSSVASASATLNVAPAPHLLHVAIRPEKAVYNPGERARFAVRVADAQGKPVRAQIGLAVVDDAIFALRPANSTDPYGTFYRANVPDRTNGSSWHNLDAPLPLYLYSVAPLKTIGSTTSRSAAAFAPQSPADTYSLNAPAVLPPPPPSLAKLRSDFRDTAYWTPAVVTGYDGRAVIAFDWPDSLTSYTASGVAVTPQTDVGAGNGGALVTKDFLVRLGAPRFLRRGDAARITAVAQGTRKSKRALLRFSAPDLGVADDTTAAHFNAHATATASWKVRGGELGSAPLKLAGTSGALSDGLRIALPVESSGTPQHVRSAGMLPSAASVALKLPREAEAGDLRVDLAPSALAQLAAGVRLLQVYPYYCVEQTMSAALPAIYVDRMRKRIHLPPPDGPAPKDVAKRAVDRLVKLQHYDGSWGWWEHDDANPFMSAYALYGLAELAHDGYAVSSETLANGVRSLARQAAGNTESLAFWGGRQAGSEWNTRAYMLFALADADPKAVDRDLLAKTDAQATKLNSYALATLGLAHLELNDRTGAQPLLDELLRRTSDDGTYAQWKGGGWHYGWQDDPIETTAYALRFVHAMAPNDPRVPHAVNWLRTQQHGSWFETTKDTAAAIYAMTEAVPVDAHELDPHETVRVTLDGRVLKSVRIDAPVLPRALASFTVPAKLVRRGGTLRFERAGTGALTWSTDWTQYVRAPLLAQLDPTFSIVRTYSAQGGNDWRVGDRIDVDVTVSVKSDVQFAAVEDPLPAGLEYQPNQYQSGDDWSGLQFFDDRVVFFANRIWAHSPIHLHYTLRATTAGSFTAPATSAYAMYGPPKTATGEQAHIAIR
jgi:alpha-2-macroglobulin